MINTIIEILMKHRDRIKNRYMNETSHEKATMYKAQMLDIERLLK